MPNQHESKLMDNRLKKIENRLRRIELLFLKNLGSNKKIKQELQKLEKEEKSIQSEQRKLETEEKQILHDMQHMEKEEKWDLEIRYNCQYKLMADNNVIQCTKTKKLCRFELCPIK